MSGWKFCEGGTNHNLILINGSWITDGYVIIADEWTNFLLDYPNFNGTLLDSTFSLLNLGETILIKDSASNIMDNLTYNTSIGADGDGKSLSWINSTWWEADPTPGYLNVIGHEGNTTFNHDIQLEVYLEGIINLHITQTKLFKITNLNPELDRVYNVTVYYNITKNNILIKEDTFVKQEINLYSTTKTGTFLPEEVGTYNLCGVIIDSTANDTNFYNDYACMDFTVVDTSPIPCNISLSLSTEKDLFNDSESIEFNNVLNNDSFFFIIEYWVEDLFNNVVKKKMNTSSLAGKSYTPTLDESDKVFLIKNKLIYVACNNSNSNINSEKLVVYKGEKQVDSSITIEKVYLGSDNKAKFGDSLRVKTIIYKGNSTKTSISAYLEKNDEKISKTTSFNVYDNFKEYTLTIPVQIDPNCKEKYSDGNYRIVVEGLDESDSESILVKGVTSSLCQKSSCSSSSLISQQKNIAYNLLSVPSEIFVGDKFSSELEIENPFSKNVKLSVWSYVYRGNKCYSGDREANLKEIDILPNSKTIVSLQNVVSNFSSGTYKFKIKILKEGLKTPKEFTSDIILLDQTKTFAGQENASLNNETTFYSESDSFQNLNSNHQNFLCDLCFDNSSFEKQKNNRVTSFVIHESTSEKLSRYTPVFIFSVFCFLIFVLLLRKNLVLK